MLKTLLTLSLCLTMFSSHAGRFWTSYLDNWHLYLNNGVAYVSSSSFPEQCKHGRAQINFSDSEYVKAMWSYTLAASKTGEKLRVVLDFDQNAAADSIDCIIFSVDAS